MNVLRARGVAVVGPARLRAAATTRTRVQTSRADSVLSQSPAFARFNRNGRTTRHRWRASPFVYNSRARMLRKRAMPPASLSLSALKMTPAGLPPAVKRHGLLLVDREAVREQAHDEAAREVDEDQLETVRHRVVRARGTRAGHRAGVARMHEQVECTPFSAALQWAHCEDRRRCNPPNVHGGRGRLAGLGLQSWKENTLGCTA